MNALPDCGLADEQASAVERIRFDGPDRSSWDRFVAQSADASLYHRSEWAGIIGRTFGHPAHYLRLRLADGGRILGLLPLIEIRSRIFGHYLVSLPYVNYGGALAESPDAAVRLMDAAGALAEDLGCAHVEFRDCEPRAGDWTVRQDKVSMRLPLPATCDELWQDIGSKLRAQIKRPQREDVETVCGGADLLEEFYDVFARNMRDLGTPVLPRRWFDEILRVFGDAAVIAVVRWKGRAAAAAFTLGYRHVMEIPWASSLREANHIGVNMLLYWTVLQTAIQRGYREFDFGRSSRDAGTFRFKRQWGAEPEQLHWHYWLREGGAMPGLNPGNPRYSLAIRLWRRLPVRVSRWIGPLIVRGLP